MRTVLIVTTYLCAIYTLPILFFPKPERSLGVWLQASVVALGISLLTMWRLLFP